MSETPPTLDDWTATQETATVEVDGHDLDVAYYDDGDSDSGSKSGSSGSDGDGSGNPVVLLHGIPTRSYLFRHVAPALAEDHRVVAPDLLGYGESAQRDGFDRSIRAQEEMLDALLADLGFDSATLVGHDIGGGVALRYAAHNPDAVDQLVLSNAVAYDSWPIQAITDIGLPSWVEETSLEETEGLLDKLFRRTLTGDADDAFVEAMSEQWLSEEGQVSLSRNAISTNTNHTTELDVTEVTAETLFLWGAEDEFQPIDYAERLSDPIGDTTTIALDDASHWVLEDRPEAYRDELLAFLD